MKRLFSFTSSYKPIFCAPKSCKPSQRTPAVMPLPQLVMTGLSPLRIFLTSARPTVASNIFWISEGARKVVYSEPCFELCFCKNTLNGSEKEYGIWPDDNPGRGSGSVPMNLTVYRFIFNEVSKPFRHTGLEALRQGQVLSLRSWKDRTSNLIRSDRNLEYKSRYEKNKKPNERWRVLLIASSFRFGAG